MEDVDLDALGAQYREAKASIGTHRARQAKAELRLARLRRKHPENSVEVAEARAKVDKAHGDVKWCQAVTVAAGEAVKGLSFDEAVAANEAGHAQMMLRRQQAMAKLADSPDLVSTGDEPNPEGD